MVYKSLLIVGLLLLTTSCEDEYFSDVPNVHFKSYFVLYGPNSIKLLAGHSIAFDESYGGYAGIILYYANEGVDGIKAFDRCCPIHYEKKDTLAIDGAIAMCPIDSVYYTLTDNPSISVNQIGGISILKSYRTIRTTSFGSTIIEVSN